jgi:TRAP-type C4-dicarboxylate transport system permease small subunit
MAKAFDGLLATCNNIASLVIVFLMLLISADVIMRGGFNAPLTGVPEIVKFSIVGMFWLQCAYCLRARKHLRTTILLGAMPRKAQTGILILNAIVGAAMFGFIAWLGWYETLKSYEIGAFEGEHPVRIPVWPLWGILVFGAVLTMLQFLTDIYRYLTDGPARDEISEVVEVEID